MPWAVDGRGLTPDPPTFMTLLATRDLTRRDLGFIVFAVNSRIDAYMAVDEDVGKALMRISIWALDLQNKEMRHGHHNPQKGARRNGPKVQGGLPRGAGEIISI